MFSLRPFVFLGVVLLLVFAAAYIVYGLGPAAGPQDGRGGPVEEVHLFKIAKGERFRDIAARLSRESLIRSIGVFKLYALTTGSAQRLQPGSYELSPTLSVPELVRLITVPGAADVAVTIPEGTTAEDSMSILVDAGVLTESAVRSMSPSRFQDRYPYLANITSFEGLLFPDTYRFRPDAAPEDVLGVLLATFDRKAWPMLRDSDDWYTRLILASLLEREVPEFDDRLIVAGILMKRVQAKIPLQVDATISYAKCAGRLRNCEGLIVVRSDLSFPSPYNTYQHLGWPPTPISNPGEAAIRAATNPRSSPYLYYLSTKKTGQTIFSRTLDEHNANRARYL